MSERIRLTKKQILFITEWLEISEPEKAAEKFMQIMIEEKVDPADMAILIDKIIARMKK